MKSRQVEVAEVGGVRHLTFKSDTGVSILQTPEVILEQHPFPFISSLIFTFNYVQFSIFGQLLNVSEFYSY